MTTSALFRQAYTLQQANQLDQAIQCYNLLLNEDPQHVDAWRYLGLAFAQLNNLPQAIHCLKQALVYQPDDPTLHLNLANALKKEDPHSAKTHYLRALALHPTYAQAHNNLAGLYAENGDFTLALRHYRDALHIDPGFTPAHAHLGLLFLKHHKLDEAKIQFQNVLALDETSTTALFYLGLLALKTDDLALAKNYFQKLLLITPEDVDTLVNLGVIALKEAQEQLAVDFFTRALALDEHHLEARNNLAATFIHFDRYENALHYYQRLLQENPENIEYQYNSAVAQMGLGHLNEAMPLFEKILAKDSKHFGALSNLAAIEMRLSHRERAIYFLTRALEVKPDDKTSALMLHALRKDTSPIDTCSSYAHDLFNHYALYYDQHMQGTLQYSVPKHIWRILHELAIDSVHRALDLGAGTGLCGMVLRPLCDELIGVDIAPKMLSVAREKKVYDQLVEAEIIAFLEGDISEFNLIIAADLLPYFGDLTRFFEFIRKRLFLEKNLFIFTTEISATDAWHLQESVRFCHHPDYIHTLCERFNFQLIRQEKIIARKQENLDLEVMLYCARADQ